MPVHGVLVERNQTISLSPWSGRGRRWRGWSESVATANDGLIGIVGIEIQAAPREDARRMSPGVAMPVRFSPDTNCEIYSSHCFLQSFL